MRSPIFAAILAIIAHLHSASSSTTNDSSTTSSPSETLWYDSPAADFNSALPIGNGRLGAMIYGGIANETINMNEDSIWSGGFLDRVNPNAQEAFPRVRAKMDAGELIDAGNDWLANMTGTPLSPRYYQPACDVLIETGHDAVAVEGYNRSLDVGNGVQTTAYTLDGVRYTRRAVASALDGVVAFEFAGSRAGVVNLNVSMVRQSGGVSVEYEDGGIVIRGVGTDDESYTFSMMAKVVAVGGTVTTNDEQISVVGADSVAIFWDAETLYYYPDGQDSYEQVLSSRLTAASKKGFTAVLQSAVEDYTAFYSRVALDLGNSSSVGRLPTPQRLASLNRTSNFDDDPELLTLMYNYGRYLMISSARPGTLPPNLQGVWNNDYSPPWGSKYTIDINLQMNYWLAEPNNLPEMTGPLWDLLRRMQSRGRGVASKMYNAPGWVCHHNTDLWGDCAPTDNGTQWTIWPMGGAWLLSHVTEHYRFTQDDTFARDTALPLLSDAIAFYNNFSVLQNATRQNYPSNSPENSYKIPAGLSDAGSSTGLAKTTQMDRALLWDLFDGFLELSHAVNSTDEASIKTAQTFLSQLQGPTISPTTSRLLEWDQDYIETAPGHRHFSPLYGLHPGHQYTPLTNPPTLATAALNLLQHRLSSGGGDTGWSRIWSASLLARTFHGDKAQQSILILLQRMLYPNLLSITSETYQIDANFGLVAAVNEMFLQSHVDGIVHLGPAMGGAKGTGEFRGWRARGGFVVDMRWVGGRVVWARIVAGREGVLRLRVEDGGRAFRVNGGVYGGEIDVVKGGEYVVTF